MAGKKDETKLIPVDLEGHQIPNYTEAQLLRKKELEYTRLLVTSTKGIYNTWSREEKHLLLMWAQENNYDTSLSHFKDIVEAFINYNPLKGNRVLRTMPKIDNSGRDIDVLCSHCARIHTFDVPVGFRDNWEFPAPCVISRKPEDGIYRVSDKHIPLTKWEFKWLGTEQGKLIPFKPLPLTKEGE